MLSNFPLSATSILKLMLFPAEEISDLAFRTHILRYNEKYIFGFCPPSPPTPFLTLSYASLPFGHLECILSNKIVIRSIVLLCSVNHPNELVNLRRGVGAPKFAVSQEEVGAVLWD